MKTTNEKFIAWRNCKLKIYTENWCQWYKFYVVEEGLVGPTFIANISVGLSVLY